jgi:hypothetical protein
MGLRQFVGVAELRRGGDGVEHGGVILPIRRLEATRS